MVMATVCNEDQVELSSTTNATQQKPHSSIVDAKLMNKPTQCYDVGTLGNYVMRKLANLTF